MQGIIVSCLIKYKKDKSIFECTPNKQCNASEEVQNNICLQMWTCCPNLSVPRKHFCVGHSICTYVLKMSLMLGMIEQD